MTHLPPPGKLVQIDAKM